MTGNTLSQLSKWMFISFVYFFNGLVIASELSPRLWSDLPINTNFMGVAYAYTEADISLDPVLKIENVKMRLNTVAAKYIRTFALLDKTARLEVLQARVDGRWTGTVNGVDTTIYRNGLSDSIVRFAVNLYGAPPLEGKEYQVYRTTMDNKVVVGAGLSVQLPTGEYFQDKLINIGNNQYIYRPQVGSIYQSGSWSTETTLLAAIYSDNNEFFNNSTLEQDPLYTIHSHFTYTFSPAVWVGTSIGYDNGGQSTINGIEKDDRKQNIAWALSFSMPLSRNVSIKLGYIGTRTQEDAGLDSDTLTLVSSFFW